MPVWKRRPTHHEENENTSSVMREGAPRGGDDILLHVTCILLIMTFPIVQMVSCRGPPQNTGPQAIACLACPIATPLHKAFSFCVAPSSSLWICSLVINERNVCTSSTDNKTAIFWLIQKVHLFKQKLRPILRWLCWFKSSGSMLGLVSQVQWRSNDDFLWPISDQ